MIAAEEFFVFIVLSMMSVLAVIDGESIANISLDILHVLLEYMASDLYVIVVFVC